MAEFDLRQLEVLCKIIELGSFSGAARAVGLSQAAVSERIATLEQQVGASLLDRGGREVTTTRAGELLHRHALELLRLRRRASDELDDLLGVRRGELHVGGSTIPGEQILPALLGRFHRRHPGVLVRLAIADSATIAQRVAEGALELGVVGAPLRGAELVLEPLWHDELVLVAPPDHRWAGRAGVEVDALRTEPLVLRPHGSGTRRLLEQRLAMAGAPPLERFRVVAELGSSAAVIQGVRAGLGVSVLSRRAVAEVAARGELALVPLEDLDLRRTFHLARHRRRSLSPAGLALAEFLERDRPVET